MPYNFQNYNISHIFKKKQFTQNTEQQTHRYGNTEFTDLRFNVSHGIFAFEHG